MKRWEVTLILRGYKVKHVVKADDYDVAVAMASRAHNGKVVVDGVKLMDRCAHGHQDKIA